MSSFSLCNHYFIFVFRGRFSVVKKCVEKTTGNEYAAKLVKKRMVAKEDVEDEIHLLRKLKHPNLSSFIDAFDTPKNYVIIVELLAGGRLFDHLVVMDNLTEKVTIGYIREILEGVQHLRDLSIVHLDLKVRLRTYLCYQISAGFECLYTECCNWLEQTRAMFCRQQELTKFFNH